MNTSPYLLKLRQVYLGNGSLLNMTMGLIRTFTLLLLCLGTVRVWADVLAPPETKNGGNNTETTVLRGESGEGEEASAEVASPESQPRVVTSSLPRVVLLVFEEGNQDALQVVENIESRMFEVEVKFGVRWMKPPTENLTSQIDQARAFLTERRVQLAIFWNSKQRDILYYLMQGESEPIERKINDVGEMSRDDAIAIISRSAVESLLDTGALQSPTVSSPVHASPSNAAPTAAAQKVQPKVAREIIVTSRSPKVVFQLGYELTLPAKPPAFLHTGNIRVNLEVLSFLWIFIGGGISKPLWSEESDFQLRQFRIPIELGASVTWTRNRWQVGGSVAMVAVPTKYSPQTKVQTVVLKEPYWKQNMLMKFFFTMSYFWGQRFGIYADIVLLIDLNKVSYKVEGGQSLFDEFYRLWPGIQLGIVFSPF